MNNPIQNKFSVRNWFILGLLTLPIYAGTSFAQGEGSGVRGGGNTQDVNGTPRLLDLVSEAKCIDDKSGDEVMLTEKGIKPILDKLRKLDWYFAADLEMEIRSLHFCYTGALKFLPPVDVDSPLLQRELPSYKSIRQLGIRNGSTVYIDQDRLNNSGMPAFDRAMFFIHEATHSYLSMDDATRRFDLYTIVAAIASAGTNRVPSREKLHYIFSQHNMEFPLTVSVLDPFQRQVEYMIGSDELRKEMILAESQPEILINADLKFLNANMAIWHQSDTPLKNHLESDIQSIFIDGSAAETARIMKEQSYSEIKIAPLALSVLPKMSADKQTIVFESNQFLSLGSDTYAWLSSLKPIYSDFRIRANSDLQSLGAGKVLASDVSLLSIEPRRSDSDQEALPNNLQALANLTAILIKNENWDQVKTLTTGNPEFSRSFELKSQMDAIDTLTVKFGGEKENAKLVITAMAIGLKARWMSIVQGQVTIEQFKTFISMIQ